MVTLANQPYLQHSYAIFDTHEQLDCCFSLHFPALYSTYGLGQPPRREPICVQCASKVLPYKTEYDDINEAKNCPRTILYRRIIIFSIIRMI